MSEIDKIKRSHHSRMALVCERQSSAAQFEHNRESTLRQCALARRAAALGWPQARSTIFDDDLGLSGSSAHQRGGFARMAAEVALGHVGLILIWRSRDAIPRPLGLSALFLNPSPVSTVEMSQ